MTYKEVEDKDYRGYDSFSVIYTLKNGRTARRYYNIWVNTETGTLLKAVKTRPEIVMSDYNGAPIETDKVNYFYVSGYRKDLSFADKEVIADFLAAVQADCREGTMAGGYEYHAGYFINENDPENLYASISVSLTSPRRGFNINIYPDSRNSLQWLKAHDPENRLGYVAQEGDYWQALEERQAGQEQMQ